MYVASRELRNATGSLLKRAQAGEEVIITVRGEPVAQLVPVRPSRRRPISHEELTRRLAALPRDPAFREDVERLAAGTTDDLGPIR
jgi:prevent-host-death family protein